LKHRTDWQKDLYDIARKFGYSEDSDGLIALMKSFRDDVIVEKMSSGHVRFKPVPNNETIDNLNLIDKSNKEIAENRFCFLRDIKMALIYYMSPIDL
jgi:hypothetical protein